MIDAAIHLDFDIQTQGHNFFSQRFDLCGHFRNKFLCFKTGIHAHDHNHIQFSEDMIQYADGGGRIQSHGRFGAAGSDMTQSTVQVDGGFRVDADDVGPGLYKFLNVQIRLGNHQVHIKGDIRNGSRCFDHQRPDGDVGNKVTIHDIDVKIVGPGLYNSCNLFAQAGEIGRED